MIRTPRPSPGIKTEAPAAASPQGLADRQQLALIAVERTRMPMVITDPRQADNPIVLANQAFIDLSGYDADELIGQNCRFLQGPGTSPEAVKALEEAVAGGRELEVEILNYRRDGTTFWNQLHISPVRDLDGGLLYFFASQKDVTERRRAEELKAAEHRLLKEVDHRAMNALALVQGIVRLTRADTIGAYSASVQSRVGALARAHGMLSRNGWTDVPLQDILTGELEGCGGRVTLDGPAVVVAPQAVQPLSLMLHEVVANAKAHGALATPTGSITVAWTNDLEAARTSLVWTEQGAAIVERRPPAFGTRLVDSIVKQQLQGSIRRSWLDAGLLLEVTFPGKRGQVAASVT